MKKRFAKIAMLLSVMLISSSLVACGTKKTETTTATGSTEPVTLKVFFSGEVKNMDKVVAEFEKRTKDTLNTKLDVTVIPSADYKEKLKLQMTAGEDMDLVFDASFLNLNTFAAQDAYTDLSTYFNNDKYPGLKKAFSTDYVAANKILGKSIAIPITSSYTDIAGLMIRKDLREKYGLGPITNDEELVKYFEAIKANDPTITPISIGGARGFYQLMGENYEDPLRTVKAGGFNVLLSPDYKTVTNVYTAGDSDEILAKNAGTKDTTDLLIKQYTQFAALSKYAEKDSISVASPDAYQLFVSGKAGAHDSEISGFTGMRDTLKKSVPTAELEFYAYNPLIRNMEKGAIVSEYKAWNFLAIPASSKKADSAMKFMDWIFQSQANHDLFELGIENEDWIAVGDDQFKLPDTAPANQYSFPGFELTWNSNYTRTNSSVPAEVKKYLDYQANPDSFIYSELAGFTFDNSSLKTEIASTDALYQSIYKPLQHGIVANPAETLKKNNADSSKVGLNTIRAEVKKQVQAFLDKKNAK